MFKFTSKCNTANLQALNTKEQTIDSQAPSSNLRKAKARLLRERCTSRARENFFTNRVVTTWNVLPDQIVNANSINGFKNKLDQFRSSS